MSGIRILLVEDHEVVREALKGLIEAQPGMSVVGEAQDGARAIQLAASLQPDVIVMDIGLPGVNGAQATRAIKRAAPQTRIVALTQYEDTSYLRELIEAGAKGYVLKRAASQALVGAIRTVVTGGTFFDPITAERLAAVFTQSASPAAALQAELSEREVQVLKLIAQGYTNKEIAAQLRVGVKSVETYKARAMDKLGLDSRAQLVRYAILRGWLSSP